ncbi:hypothetical protein [Frateuria sp. Soil773]|uniref:hypothetical protein n=1 Tax=Frateuria sp. Soil773 TaxID=1736407 RepID=UPI0012FA02F6|nr:hypothetical protein [Frateuria sp. Soil773]
MNSLTPIIVLDSSVVINILACGQPARFLNTLECTAIIPSQVVNEISRGPVQPASQADSFSSLLQSGLLVPHDLVGENYLQFLNLVGAAVPDSLGDGEAATIASAEQLQCTAIIDERKAMRIARSRRDANLTANTLDLYDYSLTKSHYSREDIASLVFNSMKHARMRIPAERKTWIIDLIGEERARQCSCFPRSLPIIA